MIRNFNAQVKIEGRVKLEIGTCNKFYEVTKQGGIVVDILDNGWENLN